MLSTNQAPKLCSVCGKNIVLEHCTMDERGQLVHTSCHEKQVLMEAATREVEVWRRNFAQGKAPSSRPEQRAFLS